MNRRENVSDTTLDRNCQKEKPNPDEKLSEEKRLRQNSKQRLESGDNMSEGLDVPQARETPAGDNENGMQAEATIFQANAQAHAWKHTRF